MGQEFRGKGVNVQLGPMMSVFRTSRLLRKPTGPDSPLALRNLMRNPDAGRNWEGFGGDPFLSGEAAFETITGIQAQGVQACMSEPIMFPSG